MQQFFDKRIKADYLHKIEIFWLKKNKLLKYFYKRTNITWGDSSIGIEINRTGLETPEGNFVRLIYSIKSQKYDYNVQLTTSNCNYGRFRYWFSCPSCSRRVGVLYFREKYFYCRHCNYLTYESKNLNGHLKKVGRIISFRELETIENEVKRQYYNGKMTRKYVRFLKINDKASLAYRANISLLSLKMEQS